jgi:hypothetical protein
MHLDQKRWLGPSNSNLLSVEKMTLVHRCENRAAQRDTGPCEVLKHNHHMSADDDIDPSVRSSKDHLSEAQGC